MKNTNKNKSEKRSIAKTLFSRHMILFIATMFLLSYVYLFLLLLFVAMLPTIISFFLDKTNFEKTTTIFFFNLSGCCPYFMKLVFDYEIQTLFAIFSGVFSWIIIYGSAALGLLVFHKLPKLFVVVVNLRNEYKLNRIEKRLSKIEEKWGDI